MTACLGKSCSFGLPRVPFVNCCQFMYLVIMSPTEGEGDILFMVRILLASALASASASASASA